MDPYVLGSGIGGAAGGIFGSINAALNRKHQIKMAQNAVQWRVADLRKAGLNPVLAAGSALGGFLGGSGSGAPASDYGMGAMAAARQQAKINDSVIGKNDAEIEAIHAETERRIQEAQRISIAQDVLRSQQRNMDVDTAFKVLQTSNAAFDIAKKQEYLGLIRSNRQAWKAKEFSIPPWNLISAGLNALIPGEGDPNAFDPTAKFEQSRLRDVIDTATNLRGAVSTADVRAAAGRARDRFNKVQNKRGKRRWNSSDFNLPRN